VNKLLYSIIIITTGLNQFSQLMFSLVLLLVLVTDGVKSLLKTQLIFINFQKVSSIVCIYLGCV